MVAVDRDFKDTSLGLGLGLGLRLMAAGRWALGAGPQGSTVIVPTMYGWMLHRKR
jgi:hypothetical protein